MTTEVIIGEINRMFSDTSVPIETTQKRLENVKEHVETLIESLES